MLVFVPAAGADLGQKEFARIFAKRNPITKLPRERSLGKKATKELPRDRWKDPGTLVAGMG